jgi:hypothetical protein
MHYEKARPALREVAVVMGAASVALCRGFALRAVGHEQ